MIKSIFSESFTTTSEKFFLNYSSDEYSFVSKRTELYRYGFNGKEKQDELHGNSGDSYDFGARIYDARLGRWLSGDPLEREYPGISPYVFSFNCPILYNDPDGKKPKVRIDAQNFSNEVGIPLTNAHQLGSTNWRVETVHRGADGKITGVDLIVHSQLNERFVHAPMDKNNPKAELNINNPGLYECVSMHEAIHAEHIKAILEDDNEIYTYGKYSGSVSGIYASFMNDIETEQAAGRPVPKPKQPG